MTDETMAPDFFDPALECRERVAARPIIGVSPHTHVCRAHVDHDGTAHICTCGHKW